VARARLWVASLWVGTRRVLITVCALAVALALLSAYVRVLLDTVQQGDLRREATAKQAAATWRCNALSSTRLREGCLLKLQAPPPHEAPINTPPDLTIRTRP
jgi:hypothetical protein